MSNKAKAWELTSRESARVYTASGYTDEGATLGDVIRKLLKKAERDGVLPDATSLTMEGSWHSGGQDAVQPSSYFTGTLTVVL